jgi:acetyltransferase-like isoleucine patch superfamily enzyme
LYYLKVLYKERFQVHSSLTFERGFSVAIDATRSSIAIGNNVQFRHNCQLRSGRDGILKIGDNVFFNNSCSVNCLSEIQIGNDCQFGESVKMYDVNHEYRDMKKLISKQGYTDGKIIIGNNCWFGSNVTILKGTIVGDNVVVGANCLLHQSIPSNTVIMQKQEFISKPIS